LVVEIPSTDKLSQIEDHPKELKGEKTIHKGKVLKCGVRLVIAIEA